MEELATLGFEGIRLEYEKAAVLPPGSFVEWGETPGNTGTVIGLGSHGEMQVRSESGTVCKLYADEVRLKIEPQY